MTQKWVMLMSKEKNPVTAAIMMLKESKVKFTEHVCKHAEGEGTPRGQGR
jgi:hypothetical protein